MAAGDDHGVGVRGQRMLLDPGRDVLDDDVDAFAEAFGVGELLAVVDDVDAEPDVVRHLRDPVADVAGTEDVDVGRRLDGLDEDLHLPAAHQTGLLREVVVELVLHVQRPAGLDRFAGFPEGVVLVAAAANRADGPAVRKDQHLGADALRRGAGGGHDGDEGNFLPAIQGLREGGEDLLVHT